MIDHTNRYLRPGERYKSMSEVSNIFSCLYSGETHDDTNHLIGIVGLSISGETETEAHVGCTPCVERNTSVRVGVRYRHGALG